MQEQSPQAQPAQVSRMCNKYRHIKVLVVPPPEITDFTTNPIGFLAKASVFICESFWLMFTSPFEVDWRRQILTALLQLIAVFSLVTVGVLFFPIFWPLYYLRKSRVSLVNASETELLPRYKPPFESLGRKVESAEDAKQLFMFFIQLSSVVYERNKSHARILKSWWNRVEYNCFEVRRVVYPTSCNATVIGYIDPSTHVFALMIAFKGTSPFDQSEWLTNVTLSRCSVRKYADELSHYNISHEGFDESTSYEIHEGFYDAFFKDPENGVAVCAFDCILQACEEVRDILSKIEEPNCVHKVYLTGHSLGAALCTVFTILLMGYKDSSRGSEILTFLQNNLRGVYTYGKPNVCNEALSQFTNRRLSAKKIKFRSIRNGNDIVSVIPLGKLYGGDYRKVGTEYRIDYYGGIAKCYYDRDDWDSAAITLRNMMFSWSDVAMVAFRALLFVVRRTLLFKVHPTEKNESTANIIKEITDHPSIWTALMAVFSSTLIEDHIPAQYVKNLYKIPSRQFAQEIAN